MRAQDFVSIRDFSPQDIRHVLDLAVQIKAMPDAYSNALRGKTLAMIFEKPSLRKRVTFDVGIHQLGDLRSIYLPPRSTLASANPSLMKLRIWSAWCKA
jgi:ornithine carbamoyltransferase